MSSERRVAIVIDGGSSVRQEYSEVIQRGVIVLPLDIQFIEGGKEVTYPDSSITTEDFYRRMRDSKELPKTSGAVIGRATNTFRRLVEEGKAVVSYHITSEHSTSWSSGVQAAEIVKGEYPEAEIEVIDSRQLSIPVWLLAEDAAEAAMQGAGVEDIKRMTLETIPGIKTEVVLETMKNLVAGGRVPEMAGLLGSLLQIKPIIEVKNGKIEQVTRTRTTRAARRELVERARRVGGVIEKLVVLHTNDPEGAEEMANSIGEFYPRERIRIYDTGPVIAVHTGERAMGLVVQRR